MNSTDILRIRFSNQRLSGPLFESPAEAVSWFGAVQSQDYQNAKWAIGQRIDKATDKSIESAFIKGEILRTHVMRPTWHFVSPRDIRWMLKLTSPRVKSILAYYNKILGLGDEILIKSRKVFEKALKNNNFLTRSELSDVLSKNGINVKGQSLGHIVAWAELDAVICSGPRKGKQFTYALVDERAPKEENLSRDESLAELVKRYFQSHGPATVGDFVWWSGLTTVDARSGIELHKPKIQSEDLNGKTYWFFKSDSYPMPQKTYLLPNYDEYTIAFKHRDDFYDRKQNPFADAKGALFFPHTIIKDGKIIGMWRRTIKRNQFELEYILFEKNSISDLVSLEAEFKKYGEFFGIKTNIKRQNIV